MLSTFLSQLQTYFSRYFVLASFCPVLVFAALNGLTGYIVFDSWHRWIEANVLKQGLAGQALLTTSFAVTIALAAFVLSSLNTFLRQFMEGQYWPWLRDWFVLGQNHRREMLMDELSSATSDLADLEYAYEWKQRMLDARHTGSVHHRGKAFPRQQNDPLEEALAELQRRKGRYDLLDVGMLETQAQALVQRLQAFDVDRSAALDKQQGMLIALIDYAKERALALFVRLQNEWNSNYGEQMVAPTKMGNVANTMQSYALRRYRCNLDVVWSNLQRVIQKDEKAQTWLLESKTLLDFLISCAWLTLGWSAVWMAVFVFIEPTRIGFLTAALGGPMVSYLWYRAATEQYRSFADIAMTLLDTFRFDLLQQMGFKVPADVQDEREMWKNIDRLSTFGTEELNLRYKASTPPA